MNRRSCFVYGPLLDPDALARLAPTANFERVAHLPEHRLGFTASGHPVVVADDGHTVWGCVFEMSPDELESVVDSRHHPGTTRVTGWAVDRDGDRTLVDFVSGPDGGTPDPERVASMVRGARHWELPAGWIVGLEDLIDPFEL